MISNSLLISSGKLKHSPKANSEMFHPDNIKNFDPNGDPVSISVHKLWKSYGGVAGLARGLKTHLKVLPNI